MATRSYRFLLNAANSWTVTQHMRGVISGQYHCLQTNTGGTFALTLASGGALDNSIAAGVACGTADSLLVHNSADVTRDIVDEPVTMTGSSLTGDEIAEVILFCTDS